MKRFLLSAWFLLLPLSAAAAPAPRHDKLAVIVVNFEGNTNPNGTLATYIDDPVAVSQDYFNRVSRYWAENSHNYWTMDLVGVYGPYVLPRPANAPSGCLWSPNTQAGVGDAFKQILADYIPSDVNVRWWFPPCAGDGIEQWAGGGARDFVQNAGGKLMGIYALWRIQLSLGFPMYYVWECRDAAGQIVTVSATCGIRGQLAGIGGDPFATGTFSHTPAQLKYQRQWLTDANRVLIDQPGAYTFDLGPMEVLTNGPMFAHIITPDSSRRNFFVEWRQPIGFDSAIGDKANGLMIRLGNNSLDLTPPGTKDNPTLLVGQTLTLAPTTSTITLLSLVPGVKATVRVVLGDETAPPPPPPPPLPQTEICNDGIDNDGDGWIDGKDPDCQAGGGTGGTTKPPSGGGTGGTTPPPTNCPAALPITVGGFKVTFRGNECTEDLNGQSAATITKQMPNRETNGALKAFLANAPSTSLFGRGPNGEHFGVGWDSPYNYFRTRLNHMQAIQTGPDTVTMSQHDPYFLLTMSMDWKVSELAPGVGAIDLTQTMVPDDPTIVGTQGWLGVMNAAYMPYTSKVDAPNAGDICFVGKTSATATESWICQVMPNPGASIMHVDASPLPLDPAPAINWGYTSNYKDIWKTMTWPRYTQPFYCTITTSTHTVHQVSFDLGYSPDNEIRFTGFRYSFKTDGQGNPAQDWQYVARNLVAGQPRSYRAHFEERPYNPATFEQDCRTADAVWRAGL